MSDSKLAEALTKVIKTTSTKSKPTAIKGVRVGTKSSVNTIKIADMNE